MPVRLRLPVASASPVRISALPSDAVATSSWLVDTMGPVSATTGPVLVDRAELLPWELVTVLVEVLPVAMFRPVLAVA